MENVLFVAEGIVFLGFIASPLAKKVISTPLNANVEISITDAVAKNRPFGPEMPFCFLRQHQPGQMLDDIARRSNFGQI